MRLRNLTGRLLPCLLAVGIGLTLNTTQIYAQDLLPALRWDTDAGSWNTGGNWVLAGSDPAESGVPGDGEIASIQNAGTAEISSDVSDVHALAISAGTVVLGEGGSLTVNNETAIGESGAISFAGGSLETGSFGVTGRIDLASSFATDLSLGTSYQIVTTSDVRGTPAIITVDGNPAQTSRGLGLQLITNDTGAAVEVRSEPVVTIDRATGDVSINNFSSGALQIAGYHLGSESGLFESRYPSEGPSFEDRFDGWVEAIPTSERVNLKAEFTLGDALTIGAGESIDFPGLMDETFLGIKPADEDVTFQFLTGDGRALPGQLEYVGPANDLVLNVDPATGMARIENLSAFTPDFELTGFTIASESGSINDDGLGQISETWDIANPTDTAITQVSLTDSILLDEGASQDIGAIFAEGGIRDLTFRYALANGQRANGTVSYGSGGPPPPTCAPANDLLGDLDGNGVVEFPDFLTLSGNFNLMVDTYQEGDIDCNGIVEFPDFLTLSGNFGQTTGAAAASVPEPSAGLLIFLGVLGMLKFRKRAGSVACVVVAAGLVAGSASESHAQLSAQFIRLHPDSPNAAINNVLEAKAIFDGLTADHVLNENIEGEYDVIDVGGGDGAFTDFQEPYLNGVADDSQSNIATRLTGTLSFEAGEYSIGCGSDEGCMITMPGIEFDETFNENGETQNGDGVLIWNGGRGHAFTSGNFTVGSGGVTTGFEAIIYEGGGGDSFEIAINDFHVFAEDTWGPDGNSVGFELEDGALQGLEVSPGPFMGGSPADFDANGTVDEDDARELERNFSRAAGPFEGDMNLDGIVDLRDVALFAPIYREANAGQAPPISIPEPSSALLMVLGALGLLGARRQRG